MKIHIAQKLHPFSHQPGTQCLIPGTHYVVRAYPAKIEIFDLDNTLCKEIHLPVEYPIEQFTVMQDLERNCVSIWSKKYHLHLLPTLEIIEKKHAAAFYPHFQETISFGSHKKQEWERMKKRMDFKELLPIWFHLGGLLSLPQRSAKGEGMGGLLSQCQLAIEKHHPEAILPCFKKLFLAGFKGLFVPRLHDEEHQGIFQEKGNIDLFSPLYLLQEGSQMIRSLFFVSSGNECVLLPNLPPEFSSGRFTKLRWDPFGVVNLEWTKKTLRQVSFHASFQGEIIFHFQKQLKTFRLRSHRKDKGMRLRCGEAIEIKSGYDYLLDQFQK